MCGIAGAMIWRGDFPRERLSRALMSIAHRGPDDSDIFKRNNVILGHARLSIIDLAGGRQPLRNSEDNLHLVANGEIYNYVELKKKYAHVDTLSSSDSESILRVYSDEGVDGFKYLNGMFAFALYDEDKQQLIVCRDRLGIKPLYYYQDSEGFYFASEIKALLPMLSRVPDIDSLAIESFLQRQFCTGEETIFKGIKRVEPGEFLVVSDGGIVKSAFWDPLTIVQKDISETDALEQFDEIFREVMREHMRADVPFGLFLSGGIDSSILLAELSELRTDTLDTFSIGFDESSQGDELGAATSLASAFSTRHHPIRVSKSDLFNKIVQATWAADDLMRDYASLPSLVLAEHASKQLKVVFSGEGGDEAFAGYRRYAPSLENWLKVHLLGKGKKPSDQWHKKVRDAVFTPRLLSKGAEDYYRTLWSATPRGWSNMQRRQFIDIKTALTDNLFVKTDRMLMAYSLEGRVPFSDHRLIEFGLSLPDHLKYHDGKGKQLLRKWASKKLPAEHLSRPKRGFYVPVKEWFKGEFSDQLEQKLLVNRAVREWFDVDGLRQVFAWQRAGKNYSRELWGIMQFAIWHRLFVENSGMKPTGTENPLDWI